MNNNFKTTISIILTICILGGFYIYRNYYLDDNKKIGLLSYISFLKEVKDKNLIKYNHIYTENDRKSILLEKVITIENKYSLLYTRELRQKEFYYYYNNFIKNNNEYIENKNINFFNSKEIEETLMNSINEYEIFVDNMLNNTKNEFALKFKEIELLEDKQKAEQIRKELNINLTPSLQKKHKTNSKTK